MLQIGDAVVGEGCTRQEAQSGIVHVQKQTRFIACFGMSYRLCSDSRGSISERATGSVGFSGTVDGMRTVVEVQRYFSRKKRNLERKKYA